MESKRGSMHIWLELPARWNSRDFITVAERRGVLLRSADLFAVDDQATPNAVRLSLSTPRSLEAVRHGLEELRAIVEEPARHASPLHSL